MKKIKILVFICLLVVMVLSISAESEIQYFDIVGEVTISKKGGYFKCEIENPDRIEIKIPLDILYTDGLSFLQFDDKKILLLESSSLCVLYEEEGFPWFFGVPFSPKLLQTMGARNSITSTSYLKENMKEYVPNNLNSLETSKPWVEGVEGSGIGERIVIKSEYSSSSIFGELAGFIFFNGYVSLEKSYLYRANNRVKEIKIYDKNGDLMQFEEIKDTPNPIFIKLKYPSETITIEIFDVYKGYRWDDTAINAIISIPLSVIPYFDVPSSAQL